ncbi:tail fiber assembly protein, partial [Salmonella enterica subsp. enterica serovar Anatum]|nr:tail fiber assembly protein [Salmonella enterica subsp. enterica serovar Anatum]
GPLPENVTSVSPDGEYQKWDGKAWVKDEAAEKAAQLRQAEETRMAAPPYSAYRNYPAYEAGALVEPTRAQPTQSLTMNYPLHVL